MAGYAHLYNLYASDSALKNRVVVAVLKHAAYIRALGDGATAAQKDWATAAFIAPQSKADALFWVVVMNPTVADAANTAGVTDEAIQLIVDGVCENY